MIKIPQPLSSLGENIQEYSLNIAERDGSTIKGMISTLETKGVAYSEPKYNESLEQSECGSYGETFVASNPATRGDPGFQPILEECQTKIGGDDEKPTIAGSDGNAVADSHGRVEDETSSLHDGVGLEEIKQSYDETIGAVGNKRGLLKCTRPLDLEVDAGESISVTYLSAWRRSQDEDEKKERGAVKFLADIFGIVGEPMDCIDLETLVPTIECVEMDSEERIIALDDAVHRMIHDLDWGRFSSRTGDNVPVDYCKILLYGYMTKWKHPVTVSREVWMAAAKYGIRLRWIESVQSISEIYMGITSGDNVENAREEYLSWYTSDELILCYKLLSDADKKVKISRPDNKQFSAEHIQKMRAIAKKRDDHTTHYIKNNLKWECKYFMLTYRGWIPEITLRDQLRQNAANSGVQHSELWAGYEVSDTGYIHTHAVVMFGKPVKRKGRNIFSITVKGRDGNDVVVNAHIRRLPKKSDYMEALDYASKSDPRLIDMRVNKFGDSKEGAFSIFTSKKGSKKKVSVVKAVMESNSKWELYKMLDDSSSVIGAREMYNVYKKVKALPKMNASIKPLFGWQEWAFRFIKECKCDRTIHWIYSEGNGVGKSKFAEFMYHWDPVKYLSVSPPYKITDFLYRIAQEYDQGPCDGVWDGKALIIDTTNGYTQSDAFFQLLETLKNKRLPSDKYSSKGYWFKDSPTIVVLANTPPITSHMYVDDLDKRTAAICKRNVDDIPYTTSPVMTAHRFIDHERIWVRKIAPKECEVFRSYVRKTNKEERKGKITVYNESTTFKDDMKAMAAKVLGDEKGQEGQDGSYREYFSTYYGNE